MQASTPPIGINHPRVQGSIQAIGGFAEAGFGSAMIFTSGGLAAPLGWAVMTHGFDHLFTGLHTAYTGHPHPTASSHLLQKTGLSPQSANLIDTSLSLAGSMGGTASFHKLARMPTQFTARKHFPPALHNPLYGTRYTKKVLFQMENGLKTGRPDFHGFPRIVDNYARFGQKQLIKGKDGFYRVKIAVDGRYQGVDGRFEWIIEQNNSINHRLFVPDN